MSRDLGYLTIIAALALSQGHAQQGRLPAVFTANVEARSQGMSGSAPAPMPVFQTQFPEGGWVIANKRSGRYKFGKVTEVWFPSAQAAEAAGYRVSLSGGTKR